MKAEFQFLELCLLNEKEQKARKINLSEKIIIFEGESTSGKSSVIKSIFFALGAEPKKMPPWIKKDTRILLKFRINHSVFYIYRFKDYLSLFDENHNLIFTISIIEQQKFSKFLCSELNLNMKLESNMEPNLQFLSVSHIFSLSYIDQDSGWQNILSSFNHTEYLKNWKHHLVRYAVGLNNISELEEEDKLTKMREELKGLKQHYSTKQQEYIDFNKRNPSMIFNFNIRDFVDEIHELENRSNDLLKKEMKIKEELQKKFSEKVYLETILHLFNNFEKKLENTVSRAVTLQDDFRCPTCGNHTDKALKIALDKAQELQNQTSQAEELYNKLFKIKQEIDDKQGIISELKNQEDEISHLLSIKKQNISLEDIISEEGKKLQMNTLNQQIADISRQIGLKKQEIFMHENAKKENNNKKDQANIMQKYKQLMELLAIKLGILFEEKETSNILPSFKSNMGSEGSRAILAHFLSILTLSNKCQQAPSLPIVIDTPFSQDPDETCKDQILQVIEEYGQKSSQLILSTSTIKQLFKKAKIYHMDKNDRYNVLKKDEMQKVKEYIEPFSHAHLKELMSIQSQLFEDTVIE